MPTPARVVEKPARQRNKICLVIGNDCFRLEGAGDHADRLYRNAACLLTAAASGTWLPGATAARAYGLMPPEETQTY
jgi:hypothetical protein